MLEASRIAVDEQDGTLAPTSNPGWHRLRPAGSASDHAAGGLELRPASANQPLGRAGHAGPVLDTGPEPSQTKRSPARSGRSFRSRICRAACWSKDACRSAASEMMRALTFQPRTYDRKPASTLLRTGSYMCCRLTESPVFRGRCAESSACQTHACGARLNAASMSVAKPATRQMDATNLLLETESTHASAKRENSVTHRSRGQRAPDLLLEPHPPVAYMIREDGVATVARHTHGTFRFGARRDVKQLEALARSSPPIRPAQHRWSPRPKTRRGAVGVAQGRQASREGQALPSRSQLFFTRQVVNSVCARRPAPRFCCKLRVGTLTYLCNNSQNAEVRRGS